MHLGDNRVGFPKVAPVETAAVAESTVIDAQKDRIVNELAPDTLPPDDAYTQARRIRCWAQAGVVLVTPALR